jgi:hypothetical protein
VPILSERIRTANWARWAPLLARVGLAVVGVGILVVGLRSAWRSDASTTALIAGAAVLPLAALLPYLDEISWGEKGLTIRLRQRLQEVSRALEAISTSGATADATAELETLRVELRQLAQQLSLEAQDVSEVPPQLRTPEGRAWFFKQWATEGRPHLGFEGSWPHPLYLFVRETDYSVLLATFTGSRDDPSQIRCEVTHPRGDTRSRVIFGRGTMQQMRIFNTYYPKDFPGAPPLEAGEYEFRWSYIDEERGWPPLVVDFVEVTDDFLATEGKPMESFSPPAEFRRVDPTSVPRR